MSAWSGGVVCLVRGLVCLVKGGLPGLGGCLPGPEGVSAWSGRCLLGPGGSAWSQGVLPARGVLLARGVCPETPPVNRIIDTCKNITLATTSLRPVINTIDSMIILHSYILKYKRRYVGTFPLHRRIALIFTDFPTGNSN